MKCISCSNEAINNKRACNDCISKSNTECIEALEISMKATEKVMNMVDGISQKEYKSAFDSYHRQRIERLILLGEIPSRKEKPRKIRF